MKKPYLISAIGTPLTREDNLHVEGLVAHLDQQSSFEIDGVLVGGTMGLMQLLTNDTYQKLVKVASENWNSRGELLIGIGDLSQSRTVERLEFVNQFRIDGVVALAPFFISFTQNELIDYYKFLASRARAPLYLYDLPQRTHTSLDYETVTRLAQIPNIAGIKCSGDLAGIRRISDTLNTDHFRVIVAKPQMIDILARAGINRHLDGIFALAPHWIREIACLLSQEEWDAASSKVQRLANLLEVLNRYGVFQSMTVILNELSVPGSFAPRPFSPLEITLKQALLDEPIIRELVGNQKYYN